MKILVTGGSGFLGRTVVRRLLADGHEVVVLARSESAAEIARDDGAGFLRGDVFHVADFEDSLAGFEVVVHAAAPRGGWRPWGAWDGLYRDIARSTIRLAQACERRGVRRLIHISSADVLRDQGELIDVDETHPYPHQTESERDGAKKLAEQYLLGADLELEILILRPSFIWGPECPEFSSWVTRARRGLLWTQDAAPIEAVHVDNAAEAVRQAISGGRDRGVYFITDGEAATVRDFMSDVLQAHQVDWPRRSWPSWLVDPLARVLEFFWWVGRVQSPPPLNRHELRAVSRPRRFRVERARQELGYQPVISRRQGFEALRPSATNRRPK